jgi:proteasome lid subunit RPN8/RPN11
MPEKIFVITQRHYEMIVQLAVKNYPEESGGFLGGQENMIKAVFPVFNQQLYDRHKSFGITSDDILRAHRFFQKHGLEYYGVYHTHPQGEPTPSFQDLKTRQKYHFIVSLNDINNPQFAAYSVFGLTFRRVPIKVIDNKGITVLDLQQNQSQVPAGPMESEWLRLSELIRKMKKGIYTYPIMGPVIEKDSDFSTFV